jgi:lipopolysaccharide export LptBFGC system permease protein LptF
VCRLIFCNSVRSPRVSALSSRVSFSGLTYLLLWLLGKICSTCDNSFLAPVFGNNRARKGGECQRLGC